MNVRTGFFKKLNKIGKLLARHTKKKTEETQINKIRDEKGELQLIPQKNKGS